MKTLLERIHEGTQVLTVELEPPKGPDPSSLLREVQELQGAIDGINITDAPLANVRMNSIVVAHLIQEVAEVPVIAHLTCRDRNLIALQSDLLGADALGVLHLLMLGGDPPDKGDHPMAKPVFDLDSVGLIALADRLNQGVTYAGGALDCPTRLIAGAAANPAADNLEVEIQKLRAKIQAGAKFIQTQPVFEAGVALRFEEAIREAGLQIPILYGVLPFKSERNAQFLAKNVPGMKIPQWAVERMASGDQDEGIRMAVELAAELAGKVAGLHLFPMGSPRILHGFLNGIGRLQS